MRTSAMINECWTPQSYYKDTVLSIYLVYDYIYSMYATLSDECYAQYFSIHLDSPVMNVTEEVDKLDPVVEAEKLKQEFEELLVVILKSLVGVDLDDLKLRISWFFNAARENTPDVQAIIDELQSKPSPQIVLNFLISRNIIGYLNYQLIKAFQKAVKNDEVKAKIEKYEEKHDTFLYHFSFNAIIEAFKTYPDLAPVSTIGLPNFTVQLKEPWEGKRVYQWKEVLDRMFTWSPHLIVVSLERKFVLTYAVLPFFISSVVQDLETPSIIKQLELEGVSVKLSSDILKSEKWDDKWHVMKELEVEELSGKKETPSKSGEDNTSEDEQDTIHNSGNSVDLQGIKYEPLSKKVPEVSLSYSSYQNCLNLKSVRFIFLVSRVVLGGY